MNDADWTAPLPAVADLRRDKIPIGTKRDARSVRLCGKTYRPSPIYAEVKNKYFLSNWRNRVKIYACVGVSAR